MVTETTLSFLRQFTAADTVRALVTPRAGQAQSGVRATVLPISARLRMKVRVWLKGTMCQHCVARVVVRKKLCRRGANRRELVEGFLRDRRTGQGFGQVGVDHEKLQDVSRCIGVTTAGQRILVLEKSASRKEEGQISSRRGGASVGFRNKVGTRGRTSVVHVRKQLDGASHKEQAFPNVLGTNRKTLATQTCAFSAEQLPW